MIFLSKVKPLVIFFLLSMTCQHHASAPPDWENEQVTAIHREPARVFSPPFASRDEALARDWRESSRVISLNGDWAFHFAKRPEERAVGFEAPDFDTSGWPTVRVPGNWQTQGWGVPIYTNQTYPFRRDEPRVGCPNRIFHFAWNDHANEPAASIMN